MYIDKDFFNILAVIVLLKYINSNLSLKNINCNHSLKILLVEIFLLKISTAMIFLKYISSDLSL